MGSLVPGWDSPVFNHIKEVEKNKSMTREEIETFWRESKKKADQQENVQENLDKESEEIIQKSLLDKPIEKSLEKFMKENGWWALTNSAFLNDPPMITEEGHIHNYVSQFHVANGAATKPNS